MADAKPGETPTPAVPTPAPATAPAPATPPAPAPRSQAVKATVADLEKRAAEAAGRGDQAEVERLREAALKTLADAGRPGA